MDALDQARAMMALIRFHRPVYLLDMFGESDRQPAMTPAERDYAGYKPSTVAFTAPTCDLWFHTGALAKQWKGRGFCCVYVKSPEDRQRTQVLGTCIHEAGHFLTYAKRPDRDETDIKQAMAYSTANPCNIGDSHGEEWLRACTHLWVRACEAGFEIPFEHVLDLSVYRLAHSQFLDALRDAQANRNLPIAELEMKVTVTATEPKLVSGDGEPIWLFPDGRVGIPGAAAGSIVASYPTLTSYWQARGDERRRSLNVWRAANRSLAIA